jgi:hypothetical protein
MGIFNRIRWDIDRFILYTCIHIYIYIQQYDVWVRLKIGHPKVRKKKMGKRSLICGDTTASKKTILGVNQSKWICNLVKCNPDTLKDGTGKVQGFELRMGYGQVGTKRTKQNKHRVSCPCFPSRASWPRTPDAADLEIIHDWYGVKPLVHHPYR